MEDIENDQGPISRAQVKTGDTGKGFAEGVATGATLPFAIIFLCSLIAFVLGGAIGAYWQNQRLKPDHEALAQAHGAIAAIRSENDELKKQGKKDYEDFLSKLDVKESDLKLTKTDLLKKNNIVSNLWSRINVLEKSKPVAECVDGEWTGVSREMARVAERNRLKEEKRRLP